MWPPQLQDLKDYLNRDDTRDDVVLLTVLEAATALVERELWGDFDFDGSFALLDPPLDPPIPSPSSDVVLGTLLQASRLYSRRRSPDGLVIDASELGSARVPSIDADIERMLGVGRWRRPMV